MNDSNPNSENPYFRVLFPTVGRQGGAIYVQIDEDDTEQLHNREAELARDICHQLWTQREELRHAAQPDEPRMRQLQLPDHPVRGSRVSVCLDCAWVRWEWSATGSATERWREHQQCIGDEPQPPDGGCRGVPGVRITPDAIDLQAGEWGPYYDWIRPRRLMREGYGIVGSLNHAARQAKELWERREQIRMATDPSVYLGQHKCVSLGKDHPADLSSPGIIGCLTCTWIASPKDLPARRVLIRRHEHQALDRDDHLKDSDVRGTSEVTE